MLKTLPTKNNPRFAERHTSQGVTQTFPSAATPEKLPPIHNVWATFTTTGVVVLVTQMSSLTR